MKRAREREIKNEVLSSVSVVFPLFVFFEFFLSKHTPRRETVFVFCFLMRERIFANFANMAYVVLY